MGLHLEPHSGCCKCSLRTSSPLCLCYDGACKRVHVALLCSAHDHVSASVPGEGGGGAEVTGQRRMAEVDVPVAVPVAAAMMVFV